MSDEVCVGLVRVEQVRFHPHNVRQDLGDLRPLAQSIANYGVMQPIVVERYGDGLRLRAGHRRLAAAKLIDLRRIPALIHSEALDDRRWLEHAVQENVMRAQLDKSDRRRTIEALRRLGCTWQGIAETFGVTAHTVHSWTADETPVRVRHQSPRSKATERLIEAHEAEFQRYLREEQGGVSVQKQRRREMVLAELDVLLGTDHPGAIAVRLGYKSGRELARVLHRWGRSDLAREFNTVSAA